MITPAQDTREVEVPEVVQYGERINCLALAAIGFWCLLVPLEATYSHVIPARPIGTVMALAAMTQLWAMWWKRWHVGRAILFGSALMWVYICVSLSIRHMHYLDGPAFAALSYNAAACYVRAWRWRWPQILST